MTKSERYGYVTNTKIKFVVVVESANTALRDNEIRTVSDGIIYLYVKLFFGLYSTVTLSLIRSVTEHRRLVIFRKACETLFNFFNAKHLKYK